MRFLFITDTHIRSTSIRSRLDNVPDTLEEKLTEIGKIAENERVDAILHGGDLFDRPDVSVMTVSRYAKILAGYPCPVYATIGNHDIFAHNPKTLPRTMIGLLAVLGLITLIPEGGVCLEGDCVVQLSAAPFRYDIDRGDRTSYYAKRASDNVDWHILIAHGMLLQKPFIADISHTVIGDLDPLDADIVLSGHYHSGFPPIESKDTLFLNPGSLLRTSNNIADIQRMPQAVLLDLEANGKKDYRFIPLHSAKPGEEVLSRHLIIENQMRQENLEQFKQLVREHVDVNRYDIYHIMEELSQSEGFEQEVLEAAMTRLALAESGKKIAEED